MPANPLYENDHTTRYKRFLMRLCAARVKSGLTQQQVAEMLGRPQSFVSRSETGARRVDIIELQAFARVYRLPINYFLEP